MDIEVKKKGLQSLMKALAMMPEGEEKEEMGEEAEHMEESKEPGTVEAEMKESPEEQLKEMAEGSEEHPKEAKIAMEKVGVKMSPSVMEKLNVDDLSLEELKAIKERMKSMGIL